MFDDLESKDESLRGDEIVDYYYAYDEDIFNVEVE